jgi:hypothetical protein
MNGSLVLRKIDVFRLFIALHLSGTSIAYEPEQALSSEHAIAGMVVL